MKVEFTSQEAQMAIELCNIANKAGGLQVAQAALMIASKFQAALNAEPEQVDGLPTPAQAAAIAAAGNGAGPPVPPTPKRPVAKAIAKHA